MTSKELLNKGLKFLKANGIQSPALDSEIIAADLLNISREQLLINDPIKLSKDLVESFNKKLLRRARREPVAYIIKKKSFWKYDFFVDQNTLVPRPETELLVENILKYNMYSKPSVLDIGVGSGCILISLVKELKSRGVGLDISNNALKIAYKNIKYFRLIDKIKLRKANLESFKIRRFDIIVSNPPYIPKYEIKNLAEDIKNHEPLLALNGGNDGLDVIKKVIYKSVQILKLKGLLALEIGNGQYRDISKILNSNGFRQLSAVRDFKNNIRCIISRLENLNKFK